MLRLSVRWMVAVLPILVIGGSLFFCEYLIYFPAILECAWPKLSHARGGEDPTPVRAMVLSDTHLLGAVGGHWFDKLRRYLSFSPRVAVIHAPITVSLSSPASTVTNRWLQPQCGCKQNMTTNRADPMCPHAQGMADGEGFPDRAVVAQARNSVHPRGHLRRRQVELPEGEALSSSSSVQVFGGVDKACGDGTECGFTAEAGCSPLLSSPPFFLLLLLPLSFILGKTASAAASSILHPFIHASILWFGNMKAPGYSQFSVTRLCQMGACKRDAQQ